MTRNTTTTTTTTTTEPGLLHRLTHPASRRSPRNHVPVSHTAAHTVATGGMTTGTTAGTTGRHTMHGSGAMPGDHLTETTRRTGGLTGATAEPRGTVGTTTGVHHRRRPSLGDKISGAMLKLKGGLTGRPAVKAAGTRRMHGTDGRGSRRAAVGTTGVTGTGVTGAGVGGARAGRRRGIGGRTTRATRAY